MSPERILVVFGVLGSTAWALGLFEIAKAVLS